MTKKEIPRKANKQSLVCALVWRWNHFNILIQPFNQVIDALFLLLISPLFLELPLTPLFFSCFGMSNKTYDPSGTIFMDPARSRTRRIHGFMSPTALGSGKILNSMVQHFLRA